MKLELDLWFLLREIDKLWLEVEQINTENASWPWAIIPARPPAPNSRQDGGRNEPVSFHDFVPHTASCREWEHLHDAAKVQVPRR